MPLPLNGVCVVGRYAGVEQVRHRPDHPTKPGEPVAGMFRLLVAVSEVEGDWPVSCTYFATDRLTYEPTRAARDVESLALSLGEGVVCKVAARSAGKFVNFDLVAIARCDDGGKR